MNKYRQELDIQERYRSALCWQVERQIQTQTTQPYGTEASKFAKLCELGGEHREEARKEKLLYRKLMILGSENSRDHLTNE